MAETTLYDNIMGDIGFTNYPSKPKSLLAGYSYTSIPYREGLANTLGNTGNVTPWYQNSELLGNAAGLGSTLVQMANLPSQIKLAKTQTKALEQNIATAKEEQDRRNKNIASFNAVRT